jgi:transcriptional regulator with XRE-family HTH domain
MGSIKLNYMKLKYFRTLRGCSIEEVAKAAGITYQTLKGIESGTSTKASTVKRICDFLKIDTQDVWEFIEDSTPREKEDQKRAIQSRLLEEANSLQTN